MKPGLEIDINPQAGSVKAALMRVYKVEVENGTANTAKREALKRWVEDYIDEIWDVQGVRQFGPTPDHRQARRQVEPGTNLRPASPRPGKQVQERPWGTPPRRPPSPEDTEPSLPTTKSSKEDVTSTTYLHSYFDHIQGPGSFSRAKKTDFSTNTSTPGPGSYNSDQTRVRSQSPRVVIARAAKKSEGHQMKDTPGPGCYSPRMRMVYR